MATAYRGQTLTERPSRFEMLVGPSPGTEYPLDRDRLTIGRAEEATISVDHNSVSRLHCEVHALGDGRYRGMWFDNSGQFRPIEARRDQDALVARWGTPDTEEGETTYRLLSESEMEVVDRVKSKDGTWREFGRALLRR